jgi:hypothetical protein
LCIAAGEEDARAAMFDKGLDNVLAKTSGAWTCQKV